MPVQVSAQLLALLSTFAANGQCEKTSYDDFYLEIHSSKAAVHGQQRREPAADQEVHVIGNTGLDKLPDILRQAVEVKLVASMCIEPCWTPVAFLSVSAQSLGLFAWFIMP